MGSSRPGFTARSHAGMLSLAASMLLVASVAGAGVKLVETDEFNLEFGLRLQPRIELERGAATGGGAERDFLLRRTRLKASGRMQKATYGFEWKIDDTDRIGSTPSASAENAWLQYPLADGVELRAGLYDQPFSRDRLTSDSKQLAVDRGEVSGVPAALGLADNVTGLEFLGKGRGGRIQWAVGLFDNRLVDGRRQDVPMAVGRLDLNLGSTKDVFQDAHFGTDRWFSLGLDGSFQGALENAAGADDSSHAALGLDGMMDVPMGPGRLFVKGELNAIRTERNDAPLRNDATVRMIAVGLLVLNQRLQPFVRFDQVRGNPLIAGPDRDITYLGANLYANGHGLKLQGDLRLQSNQRGAVDGARLQAQLDF